MVSAHLKHEEHLFLSDFCEVKLVVVEGLKNLVDSELGGAFLEVTAFVELRNELELARNDFGVAGGHIVPEEPLVHSIVPLSE